RQPMALPHKNPVPRNSSSHLATGASSPCTNTTTLQVITGNSAVPSTQHFAPDNPSTRPRSKNNEARFGIFLVAAVALLLAVVLSGLTLTLSPQSSQPARPSSDEEVDSTADLATYLIEGHEAAIAAWGTGQYGQLGSAQFTKYAPRAITEATPD